MIHLPKGMGSLSLHWLTQGSTGSDFASGGTARTNSLPGLQIHYELWRRCVGIMIDNGVVVGLGTLGIYAYGSYPIQFSA